MDERIKEASEYLGLPPTLRATKEMAVALESADTTRPPDGIDRETWGKQTEHDRMEIAKFVAMLRVKQQVERVEP